MKLPFCRPLLFVAIAGMFLTGCLFKPVTDQTRHFVLTPIPAQDTTPAPTRHLTVGIRPVRMPTQLMGEALSLRNGTNEIEYLHNALWADRLDHCFERVLAANLSRLLSSDGVSLDDWGRDQVMARVLVNVQQFEVDAYGEGTLIAQWQITAPGKDLPLKRGLVRLNRTGTFPNSRPEIIATTLSDLAADFSRQLAQEINESAQKYAWEN